MAITTKNKFKTILPENNSGKFFPLIGIILLAFIVYVKSLQNGFTNYDDDVLIINNNLVHSLSFGNIKHLFISFLNGMYHPLVTLSWALEYAAFGKNALHFHLINLLFHLMNIWLVYRFVLLLTKKVNITVIIALVFAIHPLISESVLWLSERKDLVCAAFLFGGLIHYIKYLDNEFRMKYFVLTIVFFILSLFSKPSAIVFPLLLFVIDYYRRRKLNRKAIIEKLPFFLLSIIFGIIAIMAARSVKGINTLPDYSAFDRIIFILYALLFYIFKLFIPISLSAKHFYPLIHDGFLPTLYYLSLAFFLLFVILSFKKKKRKKEVIGGILFYIAAISITLPIVPVGDCIVSERYAYIPCLGILLLTGFLYDRYKEKTINKTIKFKPILNVTIVVFLIIFCITTWNRNAVWADSDSLWTDVVNKNPGSALAYTARGDNKTALADYKGAIADYTIAIKVDTHSAVAYNNRGYVWIKEKEYNRASYDLNNAIRLQPLFSSAYYNRSCLWIETGAYQKAIADCDKVISITPDFAYAYYNRGNAKYLLNCFTDAEIDFSYAILLDSSIDVFYYYRGLAQYKKNNYKSSITDFDKTLRLNPSNNDALYYRAKCYYYLEDFKSALADFNKLTAKSISPEYLFYRGRCKLKLNDYTGASNDFTAVIAIDTTYAPAYYERAILNIFTENNSVVCSDLRQAKKLGFEIDNELLLKYCK